MKTTKDLYEARINAFFFKNDVLEWRCPRCGRFMFASESPEEVMRLLHKFTAGESKACRRCRGRSIFHISDSGTLSISLVAKFGRDDKIKVELEDRRVVTGKVVYGSRP